MRYVAIISLIPQAHMPLGLVIYYGNLPHGRDISITHDNIFIILTRVPNALAIKVYIMISYITFSLVFCLVLYYQGIILESHAVPLSLCTCTSIILLHLSFYAGIYQRIYHFSLMMCC